MILAGLAVMGTVSAHYFFTGYSWASAVNGNWSDSTKWSPSGVPTTAADTAAISAVGSYIVTLDSSRSIGSANVSAANAVLNLSSSTLTTSGGLTNSGTIISGVNCGITGPLTNNATGQIRMDAGTTLNLSSATLVNNGSITVNMNQAGAATVLNFATPCVISGSGSIQLSQIATWAQLTSGAGVTVTNGAGHTIQGRGIISAALVNNGTVAANWAAQTLTLTGQNMSNTGSIQQSSTGDLIIDGITIAQSGVGQILANGGAVHLRNGAAVVGGQLAALTTGAVYVDQGSASFQNLTVNGPLNMTAGTSASVLTGSLANNSTITVNSNQAGANTTLTFMDNAAITGTGTLQLNQQESWATLATAATKTLTLGAGQTLQGRGLVTAALVNNGLISANWAAQTLHMQANSITNSTMIKAISAGTLNLDGSTVSQIGSGQMLADGSNISVQGGASITGGVLNTVNSGTFTVPASTASIAGLTTNGSFNINAGSNVGVGLGNITNNGTLQINANQAGAPTILQFNETSSLLGNGTLQMSQSGTWAQLKTAVGKTLTSGASQTIQGRGTISAALVNQGQVLANWAAQELQLTTDAKTNNNAMKAMSDGILAVDGAAISQGPLGVIFAQSGNVQLRNSASVSGGTLNSTNPYAVIVTGPTTIQALTNQGSLNVNGGNTLNLGAGAFTNNGTIVINTQQAGAPTTFQVKDNVTVNGTGTIQLMQSGTWASLATDAGKTFTQSASHTIKGRGEISAALVNNGLVSADWSTQTLELNGSPKTNNSTMKSNAPSAVLAIQDCTINQSSNGRIIAEASNVALRGTSIVNGGKFESNTGFATYVDSGTPTINGSTNSGTINIAAGRTLFMGSNGLVDNGLMMVNHNQAGAPTIFSVPASATLSGSGVMQLNQTTSWAQVAVGANQTLTHDVGHTIQGRGQINGAVLNKGSILGNWTFETLSINPAAPGFTNQGTIGVATSGTVVINSATQFLNQGTVSIPTSHTITVNGGDFKQSAGNANVNGTLAISGGNKVDMSGGVLSGSGSVNANVANSGTGDVGPGNSAGKLHIQGTYSQSATAKATIELGGTTPVIDHDVLEISGAATLNGTLRLKIINSFVPTPAMTFTILTAGSVTGQFNNVVVEGGSVDLEPSVIYTGTQVQVTFLNKVTPTSFAVTGGILAGGVLSSLFNSDNDYVFDLCDEDNSTGRVEVTTTSPLATPTKLRFAFEAGGIRTDMVEQVEMFNYVTNAWVLIPPTDIASIADRRRVVVVTSNQQQFIKAGTLEMKARITWIPSNDTSAFDGWTTRVDQAAWFVGP